MSDVHGRTIAIGDIHGCSLALKALVDAIAPRPEDLLVPLGDYIDRGPDSRGVLEQMLALQKRCKLAPLLGNHEEMLLAARADPKAMTHWLKGEGTTTLDSYGTGGGVDLIPKEHWRFLAGCRDYVETGGHIFVHANYLPQVPLERLPTQVLRWEYLDPLWAKAHCSGKTALVGHTAQKSGELLDLGFLKCIDTYCFGGGWLTALEVGTGQVWQVDARGRLRQR
jgi:serine/threonine protein phosphatase 1